MKRRLRQFRDEKGSLLSTDQLKRNRKTLIWLSIILILLSGGFAFLNYLSRDLPSLTQLEHYEPELTTKIYSADGKVIKELYIQRRVLVPLDKIPPEMKHAVIDTEDRRFWRHWGLDTRRIIKALMVDIIHMSFREGASTITQQLARMLYLGLEKTIIRKIKEVLTALQIERTYSKREILEMYLNQVYFGHGAYGVQAAARHYFGKDAEDLTLEECALLAALPRSPNYYSPYRNPEAALKRRNLILRNMWKCGHLSEDRYREAIAKPIKLREGGEEEERDIAPYFTEYIRQKLERKYGELLYTGGFSIYTTLDTRVQACAERAVAQHLPILQERVRRNILSKGLLKDLIDPSLLEKTDLRAIMADPALVDSIINAKAAVQVALVALDVKNGHILAMIGGRDFSESQFNRAVQARRLPGSAFKPFVYTAVIDNGYPPTFEVLNQPIVVNLPDGTRWIPHNYDGSEGGPTTLRDGLRMSYNLVAARLIQGVVKPEVVVDYARKLGLTTELVPVDAIALGTSEVIPLEITSAYGAFANGGVRVEPVAILEIRDKNGAVIERNVPKRRVVLREETAYVMTDLLKTVVNRGTGYTARTIYHFYRPAGGKTGTTDDWTDAWFIGFTPQIVAGVWVGIDDPKISLGPHQAGAVAALPIWARFMKSAHDTLGLPVEDFPMPKGVVRVKICKQTKKLATKYCPEVMEEVFIKGTEPTEYCDKHRGFSYSNKAKRRERVQF